MSIKTIFKYLLIISLFFSLQTNAATNFQTFPDLQVGSVSSYVKQLQKILNSNGFLIAPTGQPGSLNSETTKFGILTQKALKNFQAKYKISPVTGNFAAKTKAKFSELFKVSGLTKGTPVSLSTEGCTEPGTAKSITQWEITWTFADCEKYGTFANGDYWVLGPVTLIDINPKTDIANKTNPYLFDENGRVVQEGVWASDGSMINPVPGQAQGLVTTGFPIYQVEKNISLYLPYEVTGNKSIYSVKYNPDMYSGVQEKTFFKETAVLTVLDQIPAPGSFRPPYAGNNKTIKPNWNISHLDYSKLRSLPIIAEENMPLIGDLEIATQRPLLEMAYGGASNSQWKSSWAYSKEGGYPRRTYGREIASIGGAAGIMLNTNIPNSAKEKLLINMVQWGIDNYGLVNEGMQWQAAGGQQHGRLLPTFIAAKVLNDSDIMEAVKTGYFQETSNHQFVTQIDVETPRTPSGVSGQLPKKPYTADMIGLPEWASDFQGPHTSAEWQSGNNSVSGYYGVPYRTVSGGSMTGNVAAILLMGGRKDIDKEALFRYFIERYYPYYRPAPGATAGYGLQSNLGQLLDSNNIHAFIADFWDAYITPNLDTMYTLTSSVTGGGDLIGQSNSYANGTTAYIFARPKPGSAFEGWSGDCPGTVNPCQITMNSDKNVTAIFRSTDPNQPLINTVFYSPTPSGKQFPSTTKTVTVTWQPEPSGVAKYYVRGYEYSDASKTVSFKGPDRRFAQNTDNQWSGYQSYVYIDTFSGTSITVPVEPGRYYEFQVYSNDPANPGIYSTSDTVTFSIAATGQTAINNPDADNDGVPDVNDKCLSTPSALITLVNNYGCPRPLLSTLKLINNISTTDFTNVGALELEDINSAFGKIKYTQPVNIFGTTDRTSQVNLDSFINILNKKVTVNSTTATQFNKPATVTLYNIDMTHPVVMKDGVVYASSTSPNMSYDPVAKTLTFTADGF